MVATSAGLYLSNDSGKTFTQTTNMNSTNYSCSYDGLTVVYSSSTNLYISLNQSPTSTSFSVAYTASGIITDCVVSGNGDKIFFCVSGVSDTIYTLNLTTPLDITSCDTSINKNNFTITSPNIFSLNPYDTMMNVFLPFRTMILANNATLTLPLYQNYCLTGLAAINLTLPQIQDCMIGIEITIYHTEGLRDVIINSNANDCIFTIAATTIITTTTSFTVSSSKNLAVKLLASPIGNSVLSGTFAGKQYGWARITPTS
jgi:hypothetical protein